MRRSATVSYTHLDVYKRQFLETQFVICRNVLIYFGDALQARALGVFERSLERGGFLLLGHCETIPDGEGTWAAVQPELRVFRRTMARTT